MILCPDIKDLKGSLNRRAFEMQWNLNKWEGAETQKYMQLVPHGSPKEASGDGGNLSHSRQLNGPRRDPLCQVGDSAQYENAFNGTKL